MSFRKKFIGTRAFYASVLALLVLRDRLEETEETSC